MYKIHTGVLFRVPGPVPKILLTMKLTIVLLLMTLLQVNATGFAQTLTYRQKNTSLREVFREIRKQTGYHVLVSAKNLANTDPLDVDFRETPLNEVLSVCLENQPLTYRIEKKTILVKRKPAAFTSTSKQPPAPVADTLRGRVTDTTGAPLPGVNIQVKGDNRGTVTDENGRYTLEDVTGRETLVFGLVGFQQQELAMNGRTVINVELRVSMSQLEEVVVVGYGTVKKSDLTGSVSSLRTEDLNKGVQATMAGLMQGKAAGVRITQASAEPGGGLTVQIRGAGSINAGSGPLYVIDGLPIETGHVVTGGGPSMPGIRVERSPLSNINPADIESIEVLKDASATAIYGARGANGVILVTTKKGSPGAMKINYSGYSGLQSPLNMIEVLSPEDYQRILNEILETPGSNVSESERVTEIQDGGTNWQDQLVQNAMVQNHSLSFNGGNDRSTYFASLNYFDQDGVLITSAYKRYDARLNLNHRTDRMLFGINFSTSYTHDNTVPVGFSTNEEGSALYAARGFDPSLRIFNETGDYQISPLINLDNPLALIYGKTSKTDNYRTLGTVFGEYTILKGLTAKLNIGVDTRKSRRDSYVSRLTKDGRANSGIGAIMTGTRNNYLGELTATYKRDLENNSSFNVMGGVTYQKFINATFSGDGRGFPVDQSETNNMSLADADLYTMNSSKNNNKLLSYIGRVNYNLLNKFLFTATLRVDGSSRFGTNRKYGYFPSGAFAWKMHEHDFVKDLNIFSSLKFRASIGRTGNQDIANFLSITTFNEGPDVILDGQQYVTLAPTRLANPDLKWETTEQIDIGFDMGFLEERISVSMDYFQKNTYDMLFDLPIPPSNGYTSIKSNIGNLKNKGFELAINSRNLTGELAWNTSFNFTALSNRVTNTGDISEIIHTGAGQSTSQIAIIRVGQTLNSFYGYKTDGIWQSQEEIDASGTLDPVKPGDVKFVDINGDHVVNTSDRQILGKSIPSLTFGMTNQLSYKNFSLNVFIDGAAGVSMLNNSKVETYYPVSHRRNRMAIPYLNRWTPSNPSTAYPSFVNPAGQGNKAVSDLTVEDASYFRLQSVQLNYQIPLKSNRIFEQVSFYVTGQNLYTWTDYTGQDPTTNSNGNSNLKIDFNSYPVYRTFIFGVELGF